jgi:hypothetical protein
MRAGTNLIMRARRLRPFSDPPSVATSSRPYPARLAPRSSQYRVESSESSDSANASWGKRKFDWTSLTDQLTTDVTFGQVQLQDVPKPLWLPNHVDVYIEIGNGKFRNLHHYSNYRLIA